MTRSIADEHYMEQWALAIALAMASTPEEQAKIDHLARLHAELMERRQAHSKANAHGLSRHELDASVKDLYMAQGTSEDVLRIHARIYFATALAGRPENSVASAREMPAHEASFVRAWIEAIGDPGLADQLWVTTTTSDPTTSSGPRPIDDQTR